MMIKKKTQSRNQVVALVTACKSKSQGQMKSSARFLDLSPLHVRESSLCSVLFCSVPGQMIRQHHWLRARGRNRETRTRREEGGGGAPFGSSSHWLVHGTAPTPLVFCVVLFCLFFFLSPSLYSLWFLLGSHFLMLFLDPFCTIQTLSMSLGRFLIHSFFQSVSQSVRNLTPFEVRTKDKHVSKIAAHVFNDIIISAVQDKSCRSHSQAESSELVQGFVLLQTQK